MQPIGVPLPVLALLVFAAAACAGCLLEWQYWNRTGSHFFGAA